MKAVFDTRAGSGYDDRIEERYHFPDRYLTSARAAVGDWVVYREPQRNRGRRGYVAAAFLDCVEPDPARAGHSYARVSRYLPFDRVVPLRENNGYYEGRLGEVAPAHVGTALQGRSVRTIPDGEFAAIVLAGLSSVLDPGRARVLDLDRAGLDRETRDLLALPAEVQARRVEQVLLNRRIRDAAFHSQVCTAYDSTCAVTRLRIINGGGRAEVQAAHIWPVAEGGPDTVGNGIALSSTVHWLFDRHLISLTGNYELMVSHNRVPAELRSLFAQQLSRIHLPADARLWPNPAYLARHRERFG